MPIPFIRGYPDGHRGLQEISRSESVERKASKFIACDGRYLIEALADNSVHLMAIIDVNGTSACVAELKCLNGPELPAAVDDLIEESVTHIPPAPRPLSLLVPAHLAEHPTVH